MSKWSDNVLGAFWKKGEANKYLSGTIDIDGKKVQILVYPNKYKKDNTHPDFIIYKTFEKNSVNK